MKPKQAPQATRSKHREKTAQVRIIGGQWRGRKLEFPTVQDLRPTGDRIRETLFNWLGADLPGARCLDLFAGSGALGIEALSRGASAVYFIDSSPQVTKQLSNNLNTLGHKQSQVVQANSLEWLTKAQSQCFDLIFVDPPFSLNLTGECLHLLSESNLLKDPALVYFEMARDQTALQLPANNWQIYRHKETGQVQYGLIKVDPA